MTTIATAEDLTLASDQEIERAWGEITAFRGRCGSQLLRNRIDTIQAEFVEELDRRRRVSEQARRAGM